MTVPIGVGTMTGPAVMKKAAVSLTLADDLDVGPKIMEVE